MKTKRKRILKKKPAYSTRIAKSITGQLVKAAKTDDEALSTFLKIATP